LPGIVGVSGKGSLWQANTRFDSKAFAARCLLEHLIVCGARSTHFKIMPPLNISEKEVEEAFKIMYNVTRMFVG
jgi:4-aminobutyrate aminotransferase-like enzyme